MILTIERTFKGWTYTVKTQDKDYSLLEFCDKLGLKYNSVVVAIRRAGYMSGNYGSEFVAIINRMRARRDLGNVKCPCCNRGRLKAPRSPRNSKFLTPKATITWHEPDGTEAVWTSHKENAPCQQQATMTASSSSAISTPN